MKSTLGLVLILIFLFIAQVSSAATDFTGVTSQAMGGAGRAAVIPTEVALLNPASFAAVSGFNLSTTYRDFETKSAGVNRNVLAHLSESQTDSMFPLAVTYFKSSGHDSITGFDREDIHLTTAQSLFDKVSFGLDVARYSFKPDVGAKDHEWDLKMGFLYAPTDTLGFGLVFTNLLVTEFDYLKRGAELGINYRFANFFRAAFDVTHQLEDNPTDESVVMLGIEHTFIDQVYLRAGFKWDNPISENYWTLGLAWDAPKIGFGYVYEKNASKTDEYGHSVDLRIYF